MWGSLLSFVFFRLVRGSIARLGIAVYTTTIALSLLSRPEGLVATAFVVVVAPTTRVGDPTHRQASDSAPVSTFQTLSRSAMSPSTSSSSLSSSLSLYPELVVYDLDACFWDQEMYEMPRIPTKEQDIILGDLNGRGRGVIGVQSGPHTISLHTGSLVSLQDHADGIKYPTNTMKVAFASSADTPKAEQIARACLQLLEVLPGMTVWDLVVGRDWKGVDINQIGRQPPLLSSNKAKSHFPRLRQLTGIRYDRMLFFDDCQWGDHCGMVASACREPDTGLGPVTLRTPYGLRVEEWNVGLEKYAQHIMALNQNPRNSIT
jgi:magnesium-dependent phosphatase 1